MTLTVRQWAALSMLTATFMVFSGGLMPANAYGIPVPAAPMGGLANETLPPFPTNLTHFVYIVRENHVFDDYLGDCALDINDTCDGGVGWTSPVNATSTTETAPSGDQLLTPYLHDLARNYSVFDNMYSSIDPYSSQAHAYLFTANEWSTGSDNCSSGGVEGTGPTTEWGIYNSSAVKAGQCSYSTDGFDENYNSTGGSVFDRFLGPNVNQSSENIPFLTVGDMIWELDTLSCTAPSTTGIPGSLPGDSVAVQHIQGCTTGWWYNASSGSATMPPAVNEVTHIPDELFECSEDGLCSLDAPYPFLDSYPADGFESFVADYGLPTYTFIELFDDHPGGNCGQTQSVCIQWNDAAMDHIVTTVENSSLYRNNTVIAISEDDTQNGANGVDHVNSGRRFPFVMVAPHNVMKSGASVGTSCGIAANLHCGLVVHQTFNTSNVLAVMERVEMNVNPSVFALGPPTGGTSTFPMVENDYLAEGDPLEPLWKCGQPGVPCNRGVYTQILTSTAISPDPVNLVVNSSVPVSATATDQNGAPISSATYSWALTPSALGKLNSSTGSTVTLSANSTAGSGHLCENATYGKVTTGTCAPVSVSAVISLASVTISPAGPISLYLNSYDHFQASSLGSNGQSLSSATLFNWTVNPTKIATLNATTGTRWVNLTSGSSTGNLTLCLNGTYKGTTHLACDAVSVEKAPAKLSSVTLAPASLSIGTNGTRTIYAEPLDQYGKPYTSAVQYQWTLSSSALGKVSPASGSSNSTLFTAGATAANGTLQVFADTGPTSVDRTMNISVVATAPTPKLTSVAVSPDSPTVSAGGTQVFTVSSNCTSTCPQGISYAWSITNKALGSINTTSGNSVKFTAGTTAGSLGLFVNGSLNGVTKESSASVTITTTPVTLTSVAISPTAPSVAAGTTESFTATPACSSTCTSGVTFSWTLNNSAAGKLSTSTGSQVTFTAGDNATVVALFVNATLNGVTKQSSPDVITVTSVLTSVTVLPSSATVVVGGTTEPFTATPVCTGNCPAGSIFTWTVTDSAMGSTSSSVGNQITFIAGNTPGNATMLVNATLNGKTVQSSPITITITQKTTSGTTSPSPGYTLYVILIVAALIAIAAAMYLMRKRKQGSGEAPPPGPAEAQAPQPPASPAQFPPPGDLETPPTAP